VSGKALWIEEMFGDGKGRGVEIEKTHLRMYWTPKTGHSFATCN